MRKADDSNVRSAVDGHEAPDPWKANEQARRRQLRDDGRRSLAVNLTEGLALSEFLSTFTGAARRD